LIRDYRKGDFQEKESLEQFAWQRDLALIWGYPQLFLDMLRAEKGATVLPLPQSVPSSLNRQDHGNTISLMLSLVLRD